jgi:hypothetical protein
MTPPLLPWFERLEPGPTAESVARLPAQVIFNLPKNTWARYPDIVDRPLFLCGSRVKETIDIFLPHTRWCSVMIVDSARGPHLYYLPYLPIIDCLLPTSELSPDKNEIRRAVLARDKIKDQPIFQIKRKGPAYVAASLTLVENMLRQEPEGIALMRTELSVS